MKTHLILAVSLFSISAGMSGAVEITYTALSNQSGPASGSGSISLPLFDPASAQIPDNAVLMGVRITLTDRSIGYFNVSNNTTEPIEFSGIGRLNVRYFGLNATASAGAGFEDTEITPFSVPVAAGGVGGMGFFADNTWSISGDPSRFLASNQDYDWFSLTRSTGFFLSSLSPAPNGNPFSGIVLIGEMSSVGATGTITYTYSVPDGGSTALLFGFGLLTLRHLKSRR
ncbi:MAG: VPDSG-CTERM sorting domain-containing protein [Verrucomicrobiota bacterium]